ncbi:hypothetical protein D3C72_2086090 [compost metagenome]
MALAAASARLRCGAVASALAAARGAVSAVPAGVASVRVGADCDQAGRLVRHNAKPSRSGRTLREEAAVWPWHVGSFVVTRRSQGKKRWGIMPCKSSNKLKIPLVNR